MSNKDNKKLPSAQVKDRIVLLVSLVVCSVVICGIYRFMIGSIYFKYILFSYIAAETVLIAVYLIYNRGFSRKNVTEEMLPSDWSDEKKSEFIENANKRLHRSRWLLVLILSFLFTFAVDIFELIVFPSIFDLLGI